MLFELLLEAAAAAPQQPALITLDREQSYGELAARAERIAHGLKQRGIERFGTSLESPIDVVAVAAAAAGAGAEVCLYPRDLGGETLEGIAGRFDHRVVVDDEGSMGLSLGELEVTSADGELTPSDAAPLLILTTGTTGAQKGARHDWSRLANAVRTPDEQPGTRWLLAYNVNQFAGIQILLHVVVSKGTLVVPASRRADDVIDAIREHHVTHASATPTFWRLIVGRLSQTPDTALGLEQITLGGEATPDGLIERLAELFPDARISHVYAGTEFGSVVSVRDGRSGMPLSVLERSSDAPAQLRIVDGELQIRSRVGMLGYHEAQDNDEDWRPTGDLVEVRGDRIHFVGRTSEIINVGGAKIHPLPIEELVCKLEGVQIAAVYGRPNAVTGQIVALDVVADAGADCKELEQRIRAACQALPAAGRPRRIRFVEELELKGNKLMRRGAETAA
ncbi:MAG TPA: class I adenylate-forming enzyme family protein [Solirubrobacteraceae bacterium]|nr:class I adenylate-forming enzyme family protein [Solirubrobacteraceae bacterium]